MVVSFTYKLTTTNSSFWEASLEVDDEALQFLSNGGGDDEVCGDDFGAVGGDGDGFGTRGFGSGETAAGAVEFVKPVEFLCLH